jgi:hypothetical protein
MVLALATLGVSIAVLLKMKDCCKGEHYIPMYNMQTGTGNLASQGGANIFTHTCHSPNCPDSGCGNGGGQGPHPQPIHHHSGPHPA